MAVRSGAGPGERIVGQAEESLTGKVSPRGCDQNASPRLKNETGLDHYQAGKYLVPARHLGDVWRTRSSRSPPGPPGLPPVENGRPDSSGQLSPLGRHALSFHPDGIR